MANERFPKATRHVQAARRVCLAFKVVSTKTTAELMFKVVWVLGLVLAASAICSFYAVNFRL